MNIKKQAAPIKQGLTAYAVAASGRMKTHVTFESKSQVYLWITNRSRISSPSKN